MSTLRMEKHHMNVYFKIKLNQLWNLNLVKVLALLIELLVRWM